MGLKNRIFTGQGAVKKWNTMVFRCEDISEYWRQGVSGFLRILPGRYKPGGDRGGILSGILCPGDGRGSVRSARWHQWFLLSRHFPDEKKEINRVESADMSSSAGRESLPVRCMKVASIRGSSFQPKGRSLCAGTVPG